MLKRLAKPLLAGLIFVVVIIIVIIIGLPPYARSLAPRSFPQADGEVQLSDLNAPVDIYRDEYGIPHIYADNEYDLFFAQGYVHAQDRFFQMDYWRHVGMGRVAELIGSPGLEFDLFLRTLGWERIGLEELELTDSRDLAILQAYADGVNAYLADHSGVDLSLEYVFINLLNPGYEPRPWEPMHTLVFAKLQAWDLAGNMGTEIDRAILAASLSVEQLEDIYPPYPDGRPYIVKGYDESGSLVPADIELSQLESATIQMLRSLRERTAMVVGLFGGNGAGIGSNNWVVSCDDTDTGMPLLANDPHMSAQIPSIWYEIGLHCTQVGPDCPYNVTGFSFASAPGIVIGHNDRIAWGFTNVGPDVMDLYIEKINPDNPHQYEVNGQWVDMEVIEEDIYVGQDKHDELTVLVTRHGPIISETYGPLENFAEETDLDLPENYAIALSWTALSPGTILQAILGFNRAQNWQEFREAASLFTVPPQNLVYADVECNIGYQTPGRIPIRNEGHSGMDIVPGWTDDYEWQGYIPFEELPSAFNPPEGYIATANNAVIGPDYPYTISREWAFGYRAQRIEDMLTDPPGDFTMDYMQLMQGDDMDLNAETLVPLVLNLSFDDEHLIEAQGLLADWNYQAHMDSSAAALFEVFWTNMLALTFHDDLPEDFFPGGGDRWAEIVRNLVEEPNSSWWDNQETDEVESRDEIFAQAFGDAVKELDREFGKELSDWRWGELHTLTFQNNVMSSLPIIGNVFAQGPFNTSGGSGIVNATGWDTTVPYEVFWLPSMRMIVDLSNLSNSVAMHTTGQSGHVEHPHYIDMADNWRNIEYHTMLWLRSEIEANAESHLILTP